MVLLGQLCRELVHGIDGRVHFPRQLRLGRCKRAHDISEAGIADDAEIHIAALALGAAGDRTEDKREVDLSLQGAKRLAHHVHQAGRFGHDGLQFLEYRAIAVGLEEHLTAMLTALKNTSLGKTPKLALDRSLPQPGQPNDLPKVEGLVGLPQEQGQHGLPGLAEQGRAKPILRCLSTHFEFNRNHIGFDRQRSQTGVK